MNDLQLLTLGQAASVLGISIRTVKRLIAAGHLVPIRPTGGNPRLTSLELERYVRETQQRAWDAENRMQAEVRSLFSPIGGRAGAVTRNTKRASR